MSILDKLDAADKAFKASGPAQPQQKTDIISRLETVKSTQGEESSNESALRGAVPDLAQIRSYAPAQDPAWTEKIRAGLEAGGGIVSSLVASVPGIPYGVFNIVKNKIKGVQTPAEDELINSIHALTPSILMPKTELGQKYMETAGTALQGMPVMGAEGNIAGALGKGVEIAQSPVSQLTAQFAKIRGAKTPTEPTMIMPLTTLAKAHNVSPELQSEITGMEASGKINPVVARRHIEADSLPVVHDEHGTPIKIKLTKGMATQDSALLSQEKNARAINDPVRKIMDDNGKAMPLVLDKFQAEIAPKIQFRTAPEEGQFYIDKIMDVHNALQEKTRAAYNDLHNAAAQNGFGDTPLDGFAFAKDVEGRFKSIGMYHEDLPSWVKRRTEEIAKGDYPLTFKNFEQFRSDLGAEQRDLQRSNASGASRSLHAVNEIRDALENIPLTKEAEQLKPLADNARKTAKIAFDLQKITPAYRDVINGTARPDDFVQKYILGSNKNAGQQQVKNLLAMFPNDDEFHQALAYSTLQDIKSQSVNAKGQLSSAKLDKVISGGENSGKHELLLPVPIRDGLDKLNKTAQLVQGAPAGAYIQTNPNLSAILGNYVSSGAYKLASGTPGLKTLTEMFTSAKQNLESKKFASESTKTGAGLDYQVGDTSK